jgi:hypothetical protein
MTIKEALIGSIANTIESLVDYISDLYTVRQSGKGGQLWTDFWRIFLSRREEKTDYAFSVKATAIAHLLFGDYDSSKINDPVTILDFEKATLSIHKARGTENGITADIKRICDSTSVAVTYYPQTDCGWIGDVTSLELLPNGIYDPDLSLCYLDLDNMLDVYAFDKSSRTTEEVKKIIRHDFVPLRINTRLRISKLASFGEGGFGEVPFGGG